MGEYVYVPPKTPLPEVKWRNLTTMKATINISVEVHDLGDLDRVENAIRFLAESFQLDTEAKGPKTAEPDSPPKARRGRSKKTEVEAEVEPEPDDSELLGLGGDDTAPTEDDVKEAVRKRIEVDGVDAVKAVFAKFKAKKLSDLKPAQYAKVLAALEG